MSRKSVLEEFNVITGWQSSKRIYVAEHFEDDQHISQSHVGEKNRESFFVNVDKLLLIRKYRLLHCVSKKSM